MEKVNFAKMEQALQRGIEQFQKEKLLGMTPSPKDKDQVKRRADTLLFLKNWHKRLPTVGCSKPMIKRIKELDPTFTEEEWKTLDELKEKLLGDLKKHIQEDALSDDDRVEKEKLRNEKKRFNVPERWLPLD